MNMAFAYHGLHVTLKVEVRDPCPIHVDSNENYWKTRVVKIAKFPFFAFRKVYQLPKCDCLKPVKYSFIDEFDLGTENFLNFVIMNIFGTNSATDALTDITGATYTGSANDALGTINLHMGAGTTTVTVGDYQIQAGSYDWSTVSATVGNTITNNTSNCTSQITGTFTNSSGSNQTAGNIGIEATDANNTAVFLLAHDNINSNTGYIVSPSGTVAATYTITVS